MPSFSDAFKAQPIYQHPKHLDFTSLQELPDSCAWDEYLPLSLVNLESSGLLDEAVPPIIDLKDPNAPKLIGHACKVWGVFQVINHGIPASLFNDMEVANKSLFSLPSHQKLKAARSPSGVSGYGIARISSFFPKLMWSEGFTIVGSPLQHFRQLWPQPQDHTKYCDVVVKYKKEVKKLAGRLMWLMLDSLGITKEDIKWAGPKSDFSDACAALQLNSYPVCPDPDRAMGLAAHTDSTLLTILHQSNISGLQVLREGVGWVTVPPLQGGLVVNVGDLLHILSNGLYSTVLHRVLVNRTDPRFSIAYLFGPPEGVTVSPQPKLVGPNRPPLYKPVTWNEYLATKGKHFNNALSLVRLCVPFNFDANDHHHNNNQNSASVGLG